jgi:hypothetical protein
MARCHNSGPDWKRKHHLTNSYWRKFQKNSWLFNNLWYSLAKWNINIRNSRAF